MEALDALQLCYRHLTPHVIILKIFPTFWPKIQRDRNTLPHQKVDHGVFEKLNLKTVARVYFLMVGELFKHAAGSNLIFIVT